MIQYITYDAVESCIWRYGDWLNFFLGGLWVGDN